MLPLIDLCRAVDRAIKRLLFSKCDLSDLNPHWKEELLRMVDADGDGKISIEECQAALKQLGIFLTTYMYGRVLSSGFLARGGHDIFKHLGNLHPCSTVPAVARWGRLYLRLKKTARYLISGCIPQDKFGELLDHAFEAAQSDRRFAPNPLFPSGLVCHVAGRNMLRIRVLACGLACARCSTASVIPTRFQSIGAAKRDAYIARCE